MYTMVRGVAAASLITRVPVTTNGLELIPFVDGSSPSAGSWPHVLSEHLHSTTYATLVRGLLLSLACIRYTFSCGGRDWFSISPLPSSSIIWF